MKKRKLKKWVIPSLCLLFLTIAECSYIVKLRAENTELNSKYSALEAKAANASIKLSEKLTIIEEYSTKVEELTTENSNLKEEVDKQNSSIDELTAELTSVQNAAEKPKVTNVPATTWSGSKLTRSAGTIQGPSGKETYYNLPMQGVINIMQNAGYNYKYWVREDGVKMYGDYVMCACSFDIRPRGTIVETSLGMGICADTGAFAQTNQSQIDIAVEW